MDESFLGPDLNSPNAARMYDYYLGGASNLAVDREAAERHLAAIPQTRDWARANRAFLGRAVRTMADAGIDQFLDLGSGVPTVGNVHEIAHRHNPDARVAYVDNEPIAVNYARHLLAGEERVTVTEADIRHPEQVLAAPGVAGLLDFTRPVGLLAVAILHFVYTPHDPAALIADYRDACVSGSYLAVSHLSRTDVTDEQKNTSDAVYADTEVPGTWRSPEEIAALLPGYQLLEPGVALLGEWRPETPIEHANALRANSYAAVGILP